jgi:molybdenum cofactor biosynthesis enzyme MoaA
MLGLVLFGKNYTIFNESCCSNTNKRTLYIEANNFCNASCSFCHNKEKNKKNIINIDKLEICIQELLSKKIIDKIVITGGEPTILSNFEELLFLVQKFDTGIIHSSITTNGINLSHFSKLIHSFGITYLNISRHHYLQEKNDYIFNNKTATDEDLNKVSILFEKRCRFNCTLTDDLNNMEEVLKYLNWIKRIGFENVLFRPIYEESNAIFKELFVLLKGRKCSDKCECSYGEINNVQVECRNVDITKERKIESENNYIRNLIYKSDNFLYGGWSKESVLLF